MTVRLSEFTIQRVQYCADICRAGTQFGDAEFAARHHTACAPFLSVSGSQARFVTCVSFAAALRDLQAADGSASRPACHDRTSLQHLPKGKEFKSVARLRVEGIAFAPAHALARLGSANRA